MKDLIWVGIRKSEIKYSNFINDSINIFGNNINSLENQFKKRINHNNEKNYDFIDDFYNNEIIKQIEKNSNVRFMYYSQIYSYDSMKKLGLLDYVICLNNQDLIEFVNNKFQIKEYLKDYIPILNHVFIVGKDFDFESLKQKYGDCEFVIQTEEGSGGFSTIVLDENNKNDIKLDKNQTYMITKYCKNNIPVNIHILISKNDITILPPSVQYIELSNNRLIYKGSDFITYQKIVNDKMDSKLKEYAVIVGKIMQKKGYRGVLGIDSIIYDDEVYFMEINPRFQNSSTILNKGLQENNLPSLQELHYNCFYDKTIQLKAFDVNYSGYINEYRTSNKEFRIMPIEKLDMPDEKTIKCENFSYLYTDLYNQPIIERDMNG